MTTNQLLDYIKGYDIFRSLKGQLNPIEVYRAATLAQYEILNDCDLLTEEVEVTFTDGQTDYDSTDSGWEFLNRTAKIKHGYNTASPYKLITEKSEFDINVLRNRLASGSGENPDPPVFFYHRKTDPVSIGFWGTPSATSAKLLVVIGGSQEINLSTDPVIPDQWRSLLILGTVCIMLEQRRTFVDKDDAFTVASTRVRAEFESQKVRVKETASRNEAGILSIHRLRV